MCKIYSASRAYAAPMRNNDRDRIRRKKPFKRAISTFYSFATYRECRRRKPEMKRCTEKTQYVKSKIVNNVATVQPNVMATIAICFVHDFATIFICTLCSKCITFSMTADSFRTFSIVSHFPHQRNLKRRFVTSDGRKHSSVYSLKAGNPE